MSDHPGIPLAGRILGWMLVVVAGAVAARIVWEVLWPLLPALVPLLALGLVYLLCVRGWRR
jgi:hypothetical protein